LLRKEFLTHFNINLDLALEAREIIRGETGKEIPGARIDRERYQFAEVTTVIIEEKSAAAIMGKPIGTYITIEAPVIRQNNQQAHREVTGILSKQLTSLFDLSMEANVLVVGLGNWNATPDSLGPTVIGKTLVTRHLFKYAPGELKGGMRPVSALAPGVLGITGIETAEIIRGVVEKVQPELVIAVDSLAARNVARIATTIQIADTGINPGSGIGNQRTGINKETMGVPVIAIGVPTVCHAAVIAKDAIDLYQAEKDKAFAPNQYARGNDTQDEVINKVLEPFAGDLTVTPKEIDTLIKDTANIIAGGISLSLHPGIPAEDYAYYLH
jgi:spore protease